MARSAVMNFMKQQGFTQEPPDRAALRFKGLQFQPIIVGLMMLVAILTQSPAIFLLLSALLGLLVVAFAALLLGKFCLGAYVYHLLKGNAALANGTCPWSDSA